MVIALDLLHHSFETTTINILEGGDKTIDEIKQILVFAVAKFISKQVTRVTKDLAMLSREK